MKDKYKVKTDDVQFEQRLLPIGISNRKGLIIEPKYIIIHEVSLGLGRSPKEYNIDHYADKILQDGLNGSEIGYHYIVSDNIIYQFIPDNEYTRHCGSEEGNDHGIAIERIICEGTDYEKALYNQAKLAATLMYKYNIPIKNVLSHKQAQQTLGPTIKTYALCYKGKYTDSKEKLMSLYLSLFKELLPIMNDKDKMYFNNIANSFSKFTIERSFSEVFKLLNKKFSLEEDKEHFRYSIPGVDFYAKLVYKACPSRLIAGQRGGFQTFYKVVSTIYNKKDFIAEVLDEPNVPKNQL